MFISLVGPFFALHGLVHLLYVAHSQRLLELQPGLAWPDGSWAFARLLGDESTRLLASIAYGIATIGFVVGGVGLLVRQPWWRPLVVAAAAFSSVAVILFWDGRFKELTDQGLLALLINAAILTAVVIVGWPSIGL